MTVINDRAADQLFRVGRELWGELHLRKGWIRGGEISLSLSRVGERGGITISGGDNGKLKSRDCHQVDLVPRVKTGN